MIITNYRSCLILFLSSVFLLIGTPVSSKHYSFLGLKDYFLIKELRTFDEAVILCNSRDEHLVEISSQAEQEYIYNTIVKPAEESMWLGATNEFETTIFKWMGDGGRQLTRYSNWETGEPSNNASQRNAIVMSYHDEGKWYDSSVNNTRYVICERTPFVLQSKMKEHSYQFNESVRLLNKEIHNAISNTSYSLPNELFKLISSMSDKQADFKSDLESLANDMTAQTTLHKRQIKQLMVQCNCQDTVKINQVDDKVDSKLDGTNLVLDQMMKTQNDLSAKVTRLLELNANNERLATAQQNKIISLEESLANMSESMQQNDGVTAKRKYTG